jgi:methyl-accepting chemotaxis protein
MKNLKMAQKLALLVSLLLLITLVVAGVGIYQLSEFNSRMQQIVKVTAKALENAFKLRNRILQVVRFEKSSVLTTEDGESIRFAEMAKGQIKEGNEFRATLSNLLDKALYNQERVILDEFNRSWDEFQRIQDKLLKLSVQNSNSKAWRLIDGELTKKLVEISAICHDIDKSADIEAKAAEQGKDIGKLMRAMRRHQAASRMQDHLDKLKLLLIAHNMETDELDMTKLDAEVLQIHDRLRKTLEDVAETVDEKDRADARRVNGLLQEAFLVGDQIRKFSHTNSTALSTNMSLAEATQGANACDAAMGKLVDSLTGRYEEDRKLVEAAYMTAIVEIAAISILGIIVGGVLGYAIERGIGGPLKLALANLRRMADGDLSQRLNLERGDEIGEITKALDGFSLNMSGLLGQIRQVADNLAKSSGDLQKLAGDMMAQSEETTTQASTVATGTEEMTATIQSMAGASEQLNMNVTSVSSASEEISVNVKGISEAAEGASQTVASLAKSIEEINHSLQMVAREAREGSEMTDKARKFVDSANQTLTALDHAADEITKVTDTIKSFAVQTNLLALNATIEATAAGEAGKGFAVVASEIKELAQQSARSAGEIANRIDEVRRGSRQAVSSMREVIVKIGEVSTSAGRISESVASQTETARGISRHVGEANQNVSRIATAIREVARGANDTARNTSEAATGTRSLSQGAAEAARVAQSIATNIHGVSEASRLGARSATTVHGSSVELGDLAEAMRKSIRQFKLN